MNRGEISQDSAEREALEIIAAFETSGDLVGLGRGWMLYSTLLSSRGRESAAASAAERAIAYSEQAGLGREQRRARGSVAWTAPHGATPVSEAMAVLEPMLASTRGRGYERSQILQGLALVTAMGGDVTGGRMMATENLAIREELGAAVRIPVARFICSEVERLAGDLDAAAEHLRAAVDVARAIDETAVLCSLAAGWPTSKPRWGTSRALSR